MITTFALLGKLAIYFVSGWKNVFGVVDTEPLIIRLLRVRPQRERRRPEADLATRQGISLPPVQRLRSVSAVHTGLPSPCDRDFSNCVITHDAWAYA